MFASQKDGVLALSLQRSLEIGSYPTAWAMLHRLGPVKNQVVGVSAAWSGAGTEERIAAAVANRVVAAGAAA